MRAVLVEKAGDESALQVGKVELPAPAAGELRLRVAAAGLNRADLLQRQGLYPPPAGASPLLGLECAGWVEEVGSGVEGWQIGERAMALLSGGGYAEAVNVPAVCAMRVPATLSLEEAAAFPEVFLTVFLNIFQLGALSASGVALVHGGGSGIGTAAIGMLKEAGGKILVTAGSDEKCQRCLVLGADRAVNYRTGDFVAEAKAFGNGGGVDVVLDSIGALYLERNLSCLRLGGRLILIGLMGGARAELSLAPLLARRLQIIGSTLRSLPTSEKAVLVRAFLARFGEALEVGRLRPVLDSVFDLEEVAGAHRRMKASEHFGKIVLRVSRGH